MTGTDDLAAAPPLPARQRAERTRGGPSFLSPAVRRLATDRAIDPSRLHGTGRGGRVTRDDVLSQSGDAIEPFSALRRTTARRLIEAKASAAHTHVMVECDYRRVDDVRRPAGLSYLPFVARAVIDALHEFPLCNATVSGEEITTHDAVHLGIAVDLDHVDLVVPVVHDAHTLRLRALSSRIGELARRSA